MGKKGRDTHYSGPQSEALWRRVNALPEAQRTLLYLAGCALQDHEGRFWQMLLQAEAEARGINTSPLFTTIFALPLSVRWQGASSTVVSRFQVGGT